MDYLCTYQTFVTGEEIERITPRELERLIRRGAEHAFGEYAVSRAQVEHQKRSEPWPNGDVYRFEICILSYERLRELMKEEYTRGITAGIKIGGSK